MELTATHRAALDEAENISRENKSGKVTRTNEHIVCEDNDLCVLVHPQGGILVIVPHHVPADFLRAMRGEIKKRRKGQHTPEQRYAESTTFTYTPK